MRPAWPRLRLRARGARRWVRLPRQCRSATPQDAAGITARHIHTYLHVHTYCVYERERGRKGGREGDIEKERERERQGDQEAEVRQVRQEREDLLTRAEAKLCSQRFLLRNLLAGLEAFTEMGKTPEDQTVRTPGNGLGAGAVLPSQPLTGEEEERDREVAILGQVGPSVVP